MAINNILSLRSMIDQTYNLVSHIYGPYPHYVLFSKKFPVVGKIPVLSNFQMLCDNKPIGQATFNVSGNSC